MHHLDAVQGVVECVRHLGIRGREARRRRRRQAAVAEEQPQRVRIHRDRAGLHLHGSAQQRQLVAVLMVAAELADHVARLDDPARPAVLAIVRRRDEPEVLVAREGRRAVLRRDAVDLALTLREHAEDRGWPSVASGHEVAHAEHADRAPAERGHDELVDRLGAATHECQRRDLDLPALQCLGDALRVEHVVQGVEQRAQVRIDLRHEIARQEAQALAGLDGRAREDDPVDLAAAQRGGGQRDGQEGLARTRRADAERDRPAPDGVDVALLVDRLRRDLARAVTPDDVVEDLGRGRVLVERAGDGRDRPGGDLVALLDELGQLLHDGRGGLHGRLVAVEGDDVAAQEDVAVDVALERPEHRVAGAGQLARRRV